MKIAVAGLWHLGSVYSLCLAELGHQIVAYDRDAKKIHDFIEGKLPVFEPGLSNLLKKHSSAGSIMFTSDATAIQDVDLLVLAYDTPVDSEDISNVAFVIEEFQIIANFLRSSARVVVTSQLPIGTCARLLDILGQSSEPSRVICHPENLRLGNALITFFDPDRIIVGTFNGKEDELVSEMFAYLNARIVWVGVKSAEMTKHALNTFLAVCVTFMGEISELCEYFGADAHEVQLALKSDNRIGKNSYLKPGLGFSGGTLARDVRTLSELQMSDRKHCSIIEKIKPSNDYNNDWMLRQLTQLLDNKIDTHVCFWGVTYTQNTNTLRRSFSYTVMENLIQRDAVVTYVEDFPFDQEANSRLIAVEDISKYIHEVDVLVVNKMLVNHSIEDIIRKFLAAQTFVILDPSRLIGSQYPEVLQMPSYIYVGGKIT